MSIKAIPSVADSVSKIIKAIYGKSKKMLILDLDNTLWGGVIGDDGVEGISIGKDLPSGEAYYEFQEYCKELKSTGIVLAINSKNDKENARKGLEHPDSVLHWEDFAISKVNWEEKSKNIIQIAEEIELGTDSFVFVDDNPAEREIVIQQVPNVKTPSFDTVDEVIGVLDHNGYFEKVSISEEDKSKTLLYKSKAEAKQIISQFSDYGDYLDSLQMIAGIRNFEEMFIPRIAQLTNKSNQFNLTTLRCTEEDIRGFMLSEDCVTLYGRLKDKFGDNGIVSVVVANRSEDRLDISLWLMSCRVLKRNFEYAMMNELIKRARAIGIEEVFGKYIPTAKNKMVENFYLDMGFTELKTDSFDKTRYFHLNVNEYVEKNTHIEVEK